MLRMDVMFKGWNLHHIIWDGILRANKIGIIE